MNEIGQSLLSTVGTAQRDSGAYKGAREVQVRAAVSRRNDSPQTQKALDRLDRILSGGQQLNRDVPRGYYLNITV